MYLKAHPRPNRYRTPLEKQFAEKNISFSNDTDKKVVKKICVFKHEFFCRYWKLSWAGVSMLLE